MNKLKSITALALVIALSGVGLNVEGQQQQQQQQRRRRLPPSPARRASVVPASRLTGLYRLDVTSSDNPQAAAERAFSAYAFGVDQNRMDELVTRLTSPDKIAIERRGNVVSIASTRAPRITFEADGRERTEPARDGHLVRTRAALQGEDLMVSSGGSRDDEFSVTFSSIDQGRRLRVTRRIFSEELNQPVVVQSVYDRISTVARWSVYGEPESERTTNAGSLPRSTIPRNSRNSERPSPPVAARRNAPPPQPAPVIPEESTADYAFAVPEGTQFVAVLNNNLSTAQSHEGDRFTMTVRSPSQYEGATIEGNVSRVDRAGPFSGRAQLTLDFQQIRLTNGRTAGLAGYIESVRADGEDVRVDTEGVTTVEERDSRTNRTAQRAAIGAAVGAIIGAIAGGGKGAVIGAGVGAGVGAGSVYVQGRDDLELRSGTEVTVRANSGRRSNQ
ncbi:MAG TPA: YMGG-like glycine zipper-containing protein [Pyrinomonadaceae bacterium]|nr:YMGG-like glycine zipper-containing protein [Pyrinomonadaceae bacterium]